MSTHPDANAIESLEFQAQQLRMISERLSYVSAMLPSPSTQWRGPAQQLFDAGVGALHRELESTRAAIASAEYNTSRAVSQLSPRVG